MSDDRSTPPGAGAQRPRPQYGEYATPEEQRARIAQPDLTYALETGQDPDHVTYGERRPPEAHAPAPDWVPLPPRVDAVAATREGRRRVDLIATMVLLGYGLVNVISSVIQLADYPTYANTILGLMGVDASFTDGAAARPWAIAASAVFVVGWLLTAAVSAWSLRRGRLTWWIPLVAGIVFNGVVFVLVLMPLMGDPAIWNAIVGAATAS